MDKHQKTAQDLELLTDTLRMATLDLAENLSQSEPIIHFQRTNNALNADTQAIELLQEASQLQQKLYNEQFTGNYSNDDVTALRVLRNQAATNETIQEQAISREEAVAFLREINMEISQLLGFDFGSLTRRPGAGC